MTSVLNSSIVSATTSDSESDGFSWLASIRMASEDVAWPLKMLPAMKEWEGTMKG